MIQTWLPVPEFAESIRVLNAEHLAVQRLSVLEVIEWIHTIDPEDSRLPDDYVVSDLDGHPILDMWKGYELQLIELGLMTCDEWAHRHGKRDPLHQAIANHLEWATTDEADFRKPDWFGDVEFHLGHQAELLRRDRDWYSAHFMAGEDRRMTWPRSKYA